MKYEEYQKIIKNAMYDYVNAGGSTFSLFKVQKDINLKSKIKQCHPKRQIDLLIKLCRRLILETHYLKGFGLSVVNGVWMNGIN